MAFLMADRDKQRRRELKSILELSDEPSTSFMKKLRGWTAEYYISAFWAIVVLLVVVTHIYYFNMFTQMRAKVRNSRAQVLATLQMRQNLIPALTVLIHHFVKHEENIFLNTAKVREGAPEGVQSLDGLKKSLKAIEAGGASPGALSHLIATAENYPQLLSSQSLQLIIAKLADAESNVLAKRNEYNDAVMAFNAHIATFPANIVASVLKFGIEPYFTCDDKPEWVFVQGQTGTEFYLTMSSKRPPITRNVPLGSEAVTKVSR